MHKDTRMTDDEKWAKVKQVEWNYKIYFNQTQEGEWVRL